uniref:Gfo/Idh/MocA family protein n=1 Tax=Herbidospora sakaeratensis TaxID=564415 RepID=UPI0007841497|nr:Gfo/Idh/MocA family oxidoreductase [Herbidospora sakaeratensis]
MSAGTPDGLRMAVMGCADIAWRRTLPAMAGDPRVHVAAIASRDLERAERFAGRFGGVAVEGYAALLERTDLDAVYIPLPALLHAEWVERALRAGLHVLVEKPLTGTYAETARLVALARSRGLVLLENYMFLHHSQHGAVRDMVARGAVGELRGFAGAFTFPPKPEGDIRYQRDVGGGAFLDFGGYPVRAALYFLGDLQVVGAVFRHDPDLDVVTSGNVLLSTPHGVAAQLTFGMEHSYHNAYRLIGSTGQILLDRVFTPPETHNPVVRIERQDSREELVLPADHQFANVVAAFARAVLTGEDVTPQQEGSLRQARLIEEIRAAAVHADIRSGVFREATAPVAR